MKKNFLKFTVMLALAAVICLPGMPSADYVQTWMENGLYGNPPTLQTWDTAEGFCFPPAPGTEYAPAAAPQENRAPAPLPPTLLLLGSGLVGCASCAGGNLPQPNLWPVPDLKGPHRSAGGGLVYPQVASGSKAVIHGPSAHP